MIPFEKHIPMLFEVVINDDLLLSEQYKNKYEYNDNNLKITELFNKNPYYCILNDYDILKQLVDYIYEICKETNPSHIVYFDELINEELVMWILSNKLVYEHITNKIFEDRFNIINKFLKQN